MKQNRIKERIIKMLEKLAFGCSKGLFRLLLRDEKELTTLLKGLDFLNISAIKRGRDNSIEIKFVDHLKALDKLYTLSEADNNDNENELYRALSESVKQGVDYEK
jgi:hypothetical protein